MERKATKKVVKVAEISMARLVELNAAEPLTPHERAGLIELAQLPSFLLGKLIKDQFAKMDEERIGDIFKKRIARHIYIHGTEEEKQEFLNSTTAL